MVLPTLQSVDLEPQDERVDRSLSLATELGTAR
jgi:hypothetical protein